MHALQEGNSEVLFALKRRRGMPCRSAEDVPLPTIATPALLPGSLPGSSSLRSLRDSSAKLRPASPLRGHARAAAQTLTKCLPGLVISRRITANCHAVLRCVTASNMVRAPMGQTRCRATQVAMTLSRFIRANLADDLSLEIIGRKFPGITEAELRRALDLCKDEVALEYERSQELLMSQRQMTAGYAALLALMELWRSQSDEQRHAIGAASAEFACALEHLQTGAAALSRYEGGTMLANLTGRTPH